MDTSELNWPEQIWKDINKAALKEAGNVRVAQKVFPTRVLENDPTQIANEVIDFVSLTVQEGDTKPLVEIYREFPVTSTLVKQEATQQTCQLLATMAAKEIALAEDAYFFQLSDRAAKRGHGGAVPVLNNPLIQADNWRTAADFGLLGEANHPNADDADPAKASKPIYVDPLNSAATVNTGPEQTARPAATPSPLYGENTFKAVTRGISKLIAKAQAPAYALFLPTEVYADTYAPPSPASLVTTYDRIKPLVEGGFHTSGVLPPDEGLLVALGGEPVKLFVGREVKIEYVRKEGASHFFRVVERVQYVVRDPRSLVLLKFT